MVHNSRMLPRNVWPGVRAVTLLAAIGISLTGCLVLDPDVATPSSAVPTPDPLRTEVRQLQEWRQEVRLEIEALQREVDSLKRALATLAQRQDETSQGLSARVRDLELVRERDRTFIVEELTRRLVELQSKMAPPQPPPAASRTGSGYEHTVKPGETLSTIARHYNTTVQAILKANALTDPNKIREGQKLFIPD